MTKRVNIDEPRWDQNTYWGRAQHFFNITNPLNILAKDSELDEAKNFIDGYRRGECGHDVSEDEIWKAKHLVDSAFHADTGEKNFIFGRMSFQVPGNMLITGCMMTFYKTTPAVIFWQFANQTFNSLVNYTNRNASTPVTNEQLLQAYGAASSASVVTALGLNKLISRSKKLQAGLIGRLVPLAAVAAANCVNIPLMRQQELLHGIDVATEDGHIIGKSKVAAVSAVSQVVPSRILMAFPAMFIPPLLMNVLEKKPFLHRNPVLKAPITVAATGICLAFSTPLCCALFPQRASLPVEKLEPELQEKIQKRTFLQYEVETHHAPISTVYYNKGL